MPTRYVDFDNGNDGNDGLGTGAGNAWKTTSKAATTLVAGELCWIRGGMSETPGADITFTNDGTVNDYCTLRGAYDGVNDPWGDGVVARPIIDFNDAAFQMLLSDVDYWKIASLQIIQSTDTHGGLKLSSAYGGIVDDCTFRDNTNRGLRLENGSYLVENCIFYDNLVANLYMITATVLIRDCVFNGGAGGTNVGLYILGWTNVEIVDSTFGLTTVHAQYDVLFSGINHRVSCRNVNFASASPIEGIGVAGREVSYVRIEDDGQVHGAYQGHEFAGNVTRSTAVERSGEGGTDWSMLMEPNSNCGSFNALHGLKYPPRGLEIYLDGTEQTITVYAYATSWAALPTVTQFVVEIEHFEGAGDWEIDTSSDTFAANDAWESFGITLTGTGFAYLRLKLLDYEDGTEKIYVDPVPEIDGLRDESLISPTIDGVGAGYEIVRPGRRRVRYHNV